MTLVVPIEGPDALDCVEAAETRHVQVEENHPWPLPFDLEQRLETVGGLPHLESGHGQVVGEHRPHVGIVVDDQSNLTSRVRSGGNRSGGYHRRFFDTSTSPRGTPSSLLRGCESYFHSSAVIW